MNKDWSLIRAPGEGIGWPPGETREGIGWPRAIDGGTDE